MGDAYVKWFRSQEYYDSGAWRGTWERDGGGALMNQGIHSVDLLTWLMGPVIEIQALTAMLAHQRIEVEDTAVATLRFANGALGVIEAATSVYPGYLKRIEIHGTGGSAVLEEEDLKAWDFAKHRRGDEVILDRDEEAQEQRRRGERSGRHRPPRPRDGISRLSGGDPRGPPAGRRRPRRPPVGGDHPGGLQVGRDGQGGPASSEGRSDA